MNIKINISLKKIRSWKDSIRRSDHIFERMKLRGIGVEQIREAVEKGAKKLRADQTIVSEYRWFKVIYREFRLNNIKKIYPITVMEI